MIINHYLFIIVCFLGLVGCNKSPKQTYNRYQEFAESKKLQGESILLDTALFHIPFRIAVRENIAIIHDLHNVDNYLHAFSFPEWKHLASFAPRGEGPGEMIICETFQFNSLDSLWALDPNKMLVYRYQIDPDIPSVSLVEEIELDKNLLRSLDLVVTSEGFIVPDYTGEYRYHVLDWNGQKKYSGGFIPKESKKNINISLAQGWRPFFDYNEQTGYLAVATQLGEVIEIYNLIDDSTHIVKYGPHGEPEFRESEGNSLPSGIMGFVDIQITEKYIYAVFEGTYFRDQYRIHIQGKVPIDGGNRIYVFDMEGNPVREYILDHHIYGIDVHEDEGIIYALDVNQDDPVLKFAF